MDSDQGGLSSSERQRQTAAEIARKKVLAAYSATVETLKNLPTNPKEVILRNQAAREVERQNQRSAQFGSPTNNSDYRSPDANPAPASLPTAVVEDTSPLEPVVETVPAADTTNTPTMLKDTPIDTSALSEEWQQYHSAWQDYYKNYYSDYYARAAQAYLATEKMKTERLATGTIERRRHFRHLIPIFVLAVIVLGGLFLQYNRLIFAPIMAYVSPDTGAVTTSLEAVDPTLNQTVSPEPRLIIPKLNIDVPVAFNISTDDVMEAMNHGVAQFAIPGANALPGQIGNLVISGHSAGDIYSSNPYKFIFSGLERLNVGDLIYVNYESVRYTYQMTGSQVVEPTDIAALIYTTDKPILTLITCTPLGTSRYRLLISAEQISPAYSNEPPSEPTPPSETPESDNTENTMPANEPSFFEKFRRWLFGN